MKSENIVLETMEEEADQNPLIQTQPAEHPLKRTDYMDTLHLQPSPMSSSTSSHHGLGDPWMQLCHCGRTAPVKTSWKDGSVGRRFWACERYGIDDTCGYFAWLDPPTCARGRELLPWLREKIDSLEKEVAAARARERKKFRIMIITVTIMCWLYVAIKHYTTIY